MAKQFDEYMRDMKPQNLLFAISSIGLLLVIGWMVLDDYSRGWKDYQKEFNRLEAEKARAEIQAAEQGLDLQQLEALQANLANALVSLEQSADELHEAEAQFHASTTATYKDDLSYRTFKSTYDATKFDYEEAL